MLPPKLRGAGGSWALRALTQKSSLGGGRITVYETQVRDRSVFGISTSPFPVRCTSPWKSRTVGQEFDVNTASVPFLTRPGMVRYKMALGPPAGLGSSPHYRHIRLGGSFVGVTNGWSLYGGAIGESNYPGRGAGKR